MTEAGWYDDPLIPGGKRYWDGAQWTEHAQGPPDSGSGQHQSGPPPFGPSGFAAQPAAATYRGAGINDIGDWLGRSFKVTFQQIGPVAIFIAFQAAFFVVAYLLAHTALADVTIFRNGDWIGVNSGLLALAGVAAAAGVLASLVTLLATHHNLYGAHVGRPPTIGESFGAGFGRLLRFIGISLLLYIAMYAVIAVAAAVIIGLSVAVGEGGAALIVVVGLLVYLAMFVFLMWIGIKFAFVTVAAVVVPRGTSAMRSAWNATRGHFWAILGRFLLLGLIVGLMFMVPYLIAVFTLPALLFSSFDFNEFGELLVDGQPINQLDAFIFGDFLPNPIATVIIITVLTMLFSLIQTVSYSGTAALYADLKAPNSFGHGTRQDQY